MNFFHAFQYFGIVWAYEKKSMTRMFRLQNFRWGKIASALIFVGLAFAYGYWAMALDAEIEWMLAITLVVSIMHFWYDGFIWSVRKKQI